MRVARRGSILLALAAALGLIAGGLGVPRRPASGADTDRIAPGVSVRRLQRGAASVRVVEVDLSAPGVRLGIASADIAVRQGLITGRALTLPDWMQRSGAVAGVNGGFFGRSAGPDHKEIVGLLKHEGRVRVAGPVYRSRPARTPYARCTLGLTAAGRPQIAWVTSRPGRPQTLRAHAAPEISGPGSAWRVREAVACGPRLVRGGRIEVSARSERLASPGALPRTFLGYGGASDRYLVLCATGAMEFEDCARFLMEYFRREHGTACSEGMALDGGGSTQAAWRRGARIESGPVPLTTVPTAVLVFSQRSGGG